MIERQQPSLLLDKSVPITGEIDQLKRLAEGLGVSVVAMSRLNRGPEQRTDRKPMLSPDAVERDVVYGGRLGAWSK